MFNDGNDEIANELRQMREIPLDQYMSAERAGKVAEADQRRENAVPKRSKSLDQSLNANSSYQKTDIDKLNELAGRKHLKDL